MKKPPIIAAEPLVLAELVPEPPAAVVKPTVVGSDTPDRRRKLRWLFLLGLVVVTTTAWFDLLSPRESSEKPLGYVACAEVIAALIAGSLGTIVGLLVWRFVYPSRALVVFMNFAGCLALACVIGGLVAQHPLGAGVGGGLILIGPIYTNWALLFSESSFPHLCLATAPLALTCMFGPFSRHWLGVPITSFGTCLWCATCFPILAIFGLMAFAH